MTGYDYTPEQLPMLLTLGVLPEQPRPESGVLIDYLRAHGGEFDRFSFSVRVGQGQTADPSFEPGVQRSQEFSSKKRMDLLAWSGVQPTIVEAKIRISPDLLGKLMMYRQLLLEELPQSPEPTLVGIGRFVDPDVARVLTTHGVTLYVYEAA
jgi:hypothetical protein